MSDAMGGALSSGGPLARSGMGAAPPTFSAPSGPLSRPAPSGPLSSALSPGQFGGGGPARANSWMPVIPPPTLGRATNNSSGGIFGTNPGSQGM